MQSRVVREELGLGLERLLRHSKHLLRVRQPLGRPSRTGQRPVAGVQAGEKRFCVTEAARHLDRFLADRHTPLDGLGSRPHLESEVGEKMGAKRAVARRKGGERLLQEPVPVLPTGNRA